MNNYGPRYRMVDVIISTAFDELNDSRAEQGIVMRKNCGLLRESQARSNSYGLRKCRRLREVADGGVACSKGWFPCALNHCPLDTLRLQFTPCRVRNHLVPPPSQIRRHPSVLKTLERSYPTHRVTLGPFFVMTSTPFSARRGA